MALALASLMALGLPAASVDYMQQGDEYFHNLHYDEGLRAYQQQRLQTPDDPNVYNHIANSLLYKELHQVGIPTSAFKKDNKFLSWKKLELSEEFEKTFYEHMNYGRYLAESKLKETPTDRWSIYFASQSYALEASYLFFVKKEYLGALRRANKARELSKKCIEHHPDFVDGYIVAGVQEYVIGSLPWYVKMVIALGGISGNKEQGLGWVRRVAEQGDEARDQARVALTAVLRREERPAEAAEIMEMLTASFPENYIYLMELASIYRDESAYKRSMDVLRTLESRVVANDSGFGRMPDQYRQRLQEEIELTQRAMSEHSADDWPDDRGIASAVPSTIAHRFPSILRYRFIHEGPLTSRGILGCYHSGCLWSSPCHSPADATFFRSRGRPTFLTGSCGPWPGPPSTTAARNSRASARMSCRGFTRFFKLADRW